MPASANQVWLKLHTAAFRFMSSVPAAILEGHAFSQVQFNSLRLHLKKTAARVVEYGNRHRVHRPTICVEVVLFRCTANGHLASGSWARGHAPIYRRARQFNPKRVVKRMRNAARKSPVGDVRRSFQATRGGVRHMIRPKSPDIRFRCPL